MHDQSEQTPGPSEAWMPQPGERSQQQATDQAVQRAREQGRAEGRQQGVIAGKIQLVEQLLGKEETALELLLQCPMPDLSGMLLDLLAQLRQRRSDGSDRHSQASDRRR